MFNRDNASQRISELNRQATKHKADKNLDAAIACLRQAKALRDQTATSYPIETWLRLPLFLQAAGHFDESMAEFLELAMGTRARVAHGAPQATELARESLYQHELATIYAKTALACKRAKRADDQRHFEALSANHHAKHRLLFQQVQEENRARYEARQQERRTRTTRR